MQRISVSFAIDVDAGVLSAFIRVIRVIRDSEAKPRNPCYPRFRSKNREIRKIRDSVCKNFTHPTPHIRLTINHFSDKIYTSILK